MKPFVYLALIATTQGIRQHYMHACDYVDDNGEEISTSLMPEYV